MDREIQIKRSYIYFYLYYVLVARFLRRYQTVHSTSSRASTWSILGTLTVILSLHRESSSFVAPSLLRFTTWRRLLRNLYRFAFQILCQLFETEKSLSPPLHETFVENIKVTLGRRWDPTPLLGKTYRRRCFHRWKRDERREIPSHGGECSLTGRQTAVSNQNRGVSNCHPPRQLNSGSRWCTTATHNLPRHVDDFTWQMYCDNSLINVELNGTTLPYPC